MFGLVLLGLGVVVAYVAWSQHVLVEMSARADYLNYARSLAISVDEHVVRGETDKIAEHLELAFRSANGEIRYIVVEDPEGRTLAVSGEPVASSTGPVLAERAVELGSPQSSLVDGKRHLFEVAVPIRRDGAQLGAVRIGVSTQRMSQAASSLFRTAAVPLAVGLLVFAGLALFVDSRLRGVLRRFIDATRRMAEGDLEHPVEIRTGDDLEVLALNFNRMADSLREREGDLRRAKETLEDAVRERTRELSAEKENLDAIVGAVGGGILLLDPQMRVLWMNRVAEDWFGPRERVVGAVCPWAKDMAGSGCPSCPSRIAASTGRTEVADSVPMDLASGRRWFTVISTPIRNKDGHVSEVLELLLDVTRRKETEEELVQASKLASVGELAGGVAHEIGNPLTIISGKTMYLLAELRKGRTPKRLVADLEKIERSTERIVKIATNLLSFSRRSSREQTRVPVGEALHEAVSLLEHRLGADNVRFTLRVPPNLPEVLACRGEIVQVFVNLLQNALDAVAPGGEVRVEARTEGGSLLILVSDTGPGMSEAVRMRVFDPFFTTKEPGRGTGLGLSICHRIVKDHHGEISVVSRPGSGTTFTVRLPPAEAVRNA